VLASIRGKSGVGVCVRFAYLSCLIIPEQQLGGARLGHFEGVFVSSDTTDRAVLLWITVNAKPIISIGIKTEKITEKSPSNQIFSIPVNRLLTDAVLTQMQLNGCSQLPLTASTECLEAERLVIRGDGPQHFY
jgi:hypothetical protein